MIYVIGTGTGGKESLTGRALRLIEGAGLLIGARRRIDEFSGLKAALMPMGGEGGRLPEIASRIESHLKASKMDVVVLATGDPLLFGIADFIIKRFGKRRVEVIPNVSVIQEAFSRIKESWNGLRVLSVHGRKADLKGLCRDIAASPLTAVFTDAVTTPDAIARALMDNGFKGLRAVVFEDLGSPRERITEGGAGQIARRRFSPLNLVLFKNTADQDNSQRFGLPDRLFSHSGAITREEIRAVTLSRMAIEKNSVVWDIGSGSGSIAVEAARLAPYGFVYAVEKNRRRVSDIRRNKKQFRVSNLEILEGAAPACLKGRGLLKPDVVFAGGGGGGRAGIKEILDYASRELKPGGRLVVNAVTMETAAAAMDFLKKADWERDLSLVNVARAKEIGSLSLLSSHNPVFIIKGVKS